MKLNTDVVYDMDIQTEYPRWPKVHNEHQKHIFLITL